MGRGPAVDLSTVPKVNADMPLSANSVAEQYFHPNVVSDAANTGGIKVADFITRFGYGELRFGFEALIVGESAATKGIAGWENNLNIEWYVESSTFGPPMIGDLYRTSAWFYTSGTSIYIGDSTTVRIGPTWATDEVCMVGYLGGSFSPRNSGIWSCDITYQPDAAV